MQASREPRLETQVSGAVRRNASSFFFATGNEVESAGWLRRISIFASIRSTSSRSRAVRVASARASATAARNGLWIERFGHRLRDLSIHTAQPGQRRGARLHGHARKWRVHAADVLTLEMLRLPCEGQPEMRVQVGSKGRIERTRPNYAEAEGPRKQ